MELLLALCNLNLYNNRIWWKGGVNVIKPEYFLEKYNIHFEQTDSVEEKMRKMIVGFGVHESYTGKEPYIFVSYSHKDSALVLPAIKALQDEGYPVWFDAGISPGSEWAADISRHLKNASLVLAFVSHSAFDSQNCRAEIVYAFGNRKPMLTVRLDKTPLPDGLDMQLSLSQMFDAFAYNDGDEFISRLVDAPIFAERISPVLKEEYAQKRRQAEEAERMRIEAEEAERQRREAEAAERLRQQAEEAERQRLAAEKAEKERLEAEEAERKYQQAKEAARLRREEEEAQQKRWEAEKQKQESVKRQRTEAQQEREKANRRKQEEQDEKLRTEEQLQKMKERYRSIGFHLDKNNMVGYKLAVTIFNDEIYPQAVTNPDAQRMTLLYREGLCDRMYRGASLLEKKGKTRRDAGEIYRALPKEYRDAGKRGERLRKKYANRETALGITLAVLYLAAHVGLSRHVLHLLPWYFDMLVMMVPMLLFCGWSHLEQKAFGGKTDGMYALMVFPIAAACVADPFMFQGIGIWARVLWTLCYTVLSILVWVFASGNLLTTVDIPKVK